MSPTALDGGGLLCITIGWISLKLWICGHLSILSIYQYYIFRCLFYHFLWYRIQKVYTWSHNYPTQRFMVAHCEMGDAYFS